MTNQYKKFAATAATATLVASAIVPVVSANENETNFADVKGTTYENAVNSIKGLGIVSGYEDGTFKPYNTVDRAGVVKFLGKFLVAQGQELPTYEEATAGGFPFKDLTASTDKELVRYAALVKEANVFTGYKDGTLNPAQKITRHQMASVLVKALDEIYGVNLIEKAKEANFKSTITDIEGNYYQDAIEALDFADITTVNKFDPSRTLNRGQFAIFLNNSINFFANQVEMTVETIGSVKAVTLVEGTDVISKLPTTIEATLKAVEGKEAEKVNLNVSWKAPENFDNKVEGNYEFVGTLTSPKKNIVIPEGAATVKAAVTIVSQADFDAAVTAVKAQADANNATAFETALKAPVLNIQNIENALVEEYQAAVADAFASQIDSVEEVQAIVNRVNEEQRLALEAAKAEQLAAIKAAQGVNDMLEAFNLAPSEEDYPVTFEHVSTTSADLEDYKDAIAAKKPADLVAVQKIIEEVNYAKAEAAVAKAEKTLNLTDVAAARAVIANLETTVYGDDVFDTVVAGKTVGSFELRLQAAALTGSIKAFSPTVKAEQVEQKLNVNIAYPTVTAEQQQLVSAYTVDSKITVPAAFAGAELVFEVAEGNIDFTVPAVAKEGDTTITFSLLDVLNTQASTLASQSATSFDVKVTVPYETTTLAVGNYTLKLDTVVAAGTGETADVRTLSSEAITVKVVADPAVPTAVQAVLAATDANLLGALNDLKALDSTLVFKEANVAEYLKAFNAYSTDQDKAATVTSLLATIKAVDEAVALENAIDTLVATDAQNYDVLAALKVAQFGFSAVKEDNKLNVVNKNAELYIKAIEADATATVAGEETYTTAADVQAMVDEVNASKLGTLNAATSLTTIEAALKGLNNNDIDLVYNELVADGKRLATLEAIKNSAGFASEDDVESFLLGLAL